MRKHKLHFQLSVLIGTTFLFIALNSTKTTSTTTAPVQCVNQTGMDCAAVCSSCYTSVQDAVDTASPDSEIRIAGGSYTDPGGTVISINKRVSVVGGWDSTCGIHNPELYPVVLDSVHLLTTSDATYTNGHLGVILFRATATYDDVFVSW